MITEGEKRFILERAVVPEHLVDLMTLVSGGEAHLVEGWFCVTGPDWLVVVGYPLDEDPVAATDAHAFDGESFAGAVERMLCRFRPAKAWLVAPAIPPSLAARAVERESDRYHLLDLEADVPRGRLAGIVERARECFRVEASSVMTTRHGELIEEFITRAAPHPRVRRLALAMPDYVRACPRAVVLDASAADGRLAAFSVMDFSAERFAAYVIGYASRLGFASHASDLLMAEMARLSRIEGKSHLHLGLGVNAGIRRFKAKWGGVPGPPYELAGIRGARPSMLRSLLGFR